MERVVTLTLLAIALAPLYADPQHPRSAGKKTASPASVHPKSNTVSASAVRSAHLAVSARSAHLSSPKARARSARVSRAVRIAPAPTYQLHPDPERYQIIQKALADRGYFKGNLNGTWDTDSIDAMRRFQADQKIDNDGKIDSLSLISLGLGPKHDGSTAAQSRLAPATESILPAPVLQPSTPASIAGEPR